MKRTNIMTLSVGVLMTITSVVAGTEIDTLKSRTTALENEAVKFEISGMASINYAKGNQTDKEIYVDEVELGIATHLTEDLKANIIFLSEVDDDVDNELKNPVVDEAVIGGNINGIDFSVGKQGAPFGVYETAMISNATEDMGDTTTKSLILATEVNGVALTTWIGSSKTNGFGIGYEGENFAIGPYVKLQFEAHLHLYQVC